jgi:hypothetical protein
LRGTFARHDEKVPRPRSASCSLHVASVTLTHRMVSSATGHDVMDVIEYDAKCDM